jgi:hypothetical protein
MKKTINIHVQNMLGEDFFYNKVGSVAELRQKIATKQGIPPECCSFVLIEEHEEQEAKEEQEVSLYLQLLQDIQNTIKNDKVAERIQQIKEEQPLESMVYQGDPMSQGIPRTQEHFKTRKNPKKKIDDRKPYTYLDATSRSKLDETIQSIINEYAQDLLQHVRSCLVQAPGEVTPEQILISYEAQDPQKKTNIQQTVANYYANHPDTSEKIKENCVSIIKAQLTLECTSVVLIIRSKANKIKDIPLNEHKIPLKISIGAENEEEDDNFLLPRHHSIADYLSDMARFHDTLSDLKPGKQTTTNHELTQTIRNNVRLHLITWIWSCQDATDNEKKTFAMKQYGQAVTYQKTCLNKYLQENDNIDLKEDETNQIIGAEITNQLKQLKSHSSVWQNLAEISRIISNLEATIRTKLQTNLFALYRIHLQQILPEYADDLHEPFLLMSTTLHKSEHNIARVQARQALPKGPHRDVTRALGALHITLTGNSAVPERNSNQITNRVELALKPETEKHERFQQNKCTALNNSDPWRQTLGLRLLFLACMFFISPYALALGMLYVLYTVFANPPPQSTDSLEKPANTQWVNFFHVPMRELRTDWQLSFATVFDPVNFFLPIAFIITYFAIVHSIHLIPMLMGMIGTGASLLTLMLQQVQPTSSLMLLIKFLIYSFLTLLITSTAISTMVDNITSISCNQMYTPILSLAFLVLLAVSPSLTTFILLVNIALPCYLLACIILCPSEEPSSLNTMDYDRAKNNIIMRAPYACTLLLVLIQWARFFYQNDPYTPVGLIAAKMPVVMYLLSGLILLEMLAYLYYFFFSGANSPYGEWKRTLYRPFSPHELNPFPPNNPLNRAFVWWCKCVFPIPLIQFFFCRNTRIHWKELGIFISFWAANVLMHSILCAYYPSTNLFIISHSMIMIPSLGFTLLFFLGGIFLSSLDCISYIPTHTIQSLQRNQDFSGNHFHIQNNGIPTTNSERIMVCLMNSIPIIIILFSIFIYFHAPLPSISPDYINDFLIVTKSSFALILAFYYGEQYQKIIDTNMEFKHNPPNNEGKIHVNSHEFQPIDSFYVSTQKITHPIAVVSFQCASSEIFR